VLLVSGGLGVQGAADQQFSRPKIIARQLMMTESKTTRSVPGRSTITAATSPRSPKRSRKEATYAVPG
jgi:hypothetical protein